MLVRWPLEEMAHSIASAIPTGDFRFLVVRKGLGDSLVEALVSAVRAEVAVYEARRSASGNGLEESAPGCHNGSPDLFLQRESQV